MKIASWGMAIAIGSLLWIVGQSAEGQTWSESNPLRSGLSQRDGQGADHRLERSGRPASLLEQAEVPPEVLSALYPPKSSSYFVQEEGDVGLAFGGSDSGVIEGQVRTASYIEPNSETDVPRYAGPTLHDLLAESNRELRESPEVPIGAEGAKHDGRPEAGLAPDHDLLGTVRNMASNTVLVIVLGVGFVLAAKRWLVRSGKFDARHTDRRRGTGDSKIAVVAKLKISTKSCVHLLAVGDRQIVVASDMSGIKSVVALPPTFAAEWGSNEEHSAERYEVDEDVAVTYSPDRVRSAAPRREPQTGQAQTSAPSVTDVEAEMKRQLAELLGGQAFRDVFYQETRGVS
ncbi:MAG TPA: hypothetical protein PKD54_04890 [Pirellulaceae bacterium]|nr:hypothetical protein [Pirellulaceae bacterium]